MYDIDNEVMDKMIQEAALTDMDLFIEFCLAKIYNNANL